MRTLEGKLIAKDLKFAIVVARFNEFITSKLLGGALDCLTRHEASEDDITVAWVPGAFEIPLAIQKMAQSRKFDALIAIGTVIQGATPHAGLIGSQVARALGQISLKEDIPVIDGVVTADNLEQAIERSGTKAGNRGWNAALAAIEMANLMRAMKD